MGGLKDFADLKALRETLREQEHARAVEKAEREKREQKAREEANVFHSATKGIKPIPASDRYVAPMARIPVRGASAKARTVEEDNAAVLRESLSDQFDVEGLLDDDPTISYSAPGVGPDVARKLRKRHWPVQDELDLHDMNRETARDQVGDFLRRAMNRGLRCVRVIHGKGYGSAGGEPVLRPMVHSWLVQKDEVVAFCVANKGDGGHGALIVLLKPALDR
ncbi:MAG TPA: Smr/MutS family protein [Telluria sp.]|nr:Smr/MutS family protein [Telluria sp.]